MEELRALEEWAMELEGAQEDGVELGFDGVAVRAAVAALWSVASRAATDADAATAGYGGPVGPEALLVSADDRTGYEPIRTGSVDAAHVVVLRGAVEACASASGELEWVLEGAAERWHRGPAHEVDSGAPLRALAAVLDVLSLEGEDVAILRAALLDPAARRDGGDFVLSPAADAARGRVADRIVRVFYGPTGVLERWRMG